jgi:alkanesulfonate monooxygenase SsuD/methylene tetrahydromethanopterin reductase-like flavin-dependent oxidoreductase (luciferase family)
MTIGIEPDADTAAIAELRLRGSTAEVQRRPFGAEPRHAYDLIVFVASLHHLPLKAALEDARSALRPGGRIVIVGVADETSPDAVRSWISLLLNPLIGVVLHPSRAKVPFADLHRRALAQFGHDRQPVGVHSPAFFAATDQEAVDVAWPAWEHAVNQEAKVRGWAKADKGRFLAEVASGSQYVGSPETVAPRIASTIRLFGAERFDLSYALGPLPHEARMSMIELFGREVIPRVRSILAEDAIEGGVESGDGEEDATAPVAAASRP